MLLSFSLFCWDLFLDLANPFPQYLFCFKDSKLSFRPRNPEIILAWIQSCLLLSSTVWENDCRNKRWWAQRSISCRNACSCCWWWPNLSFGLGNSPSKMPISWFASYAFHSLLFCLRICVFICVICFFRFWVSVSVSV